MDVMLRKYFDSFLACPLFAGTDPQDLTVMLQCFNPVPRLYKKNEVLTREGERLRGIGVILAGEAVVSKENAAGKRIIMELINPGSIFGEMAAFTENARWPATVVAQEACTAVFLPPDKITGNCEKQCFSHRLLITNMLKIVSGKALMLNKKVEYLAMKSLRARISAFILEEHKRTGKSMFMMPMNRNEIADFLSVTRPSLSREMCRMRDEGIIDFHLSSVRILDMEKLKQAAE